MSNEELLVRFRVSANPELFRALIRRTSLAAKREGRRMGLAPFEIDDLLQETYLAVLLHAASFDESQAAAAWIRGIARKKALLIRQRRSRAENSENATTPLEPSDAVSSEEVRREVLDSLKKLHPRYREVIQLYYLEHKNTVEIGEILGRPVSTVRTQMQRGLQELRRFLPHGLAPLALCVFELDAIPPTGGSPTAEQQKASPPPLVAPRTAALASLGVGLAGVVFTAAVLASSEEPLQVEATAAAAQEESTPMRAGPRLDREPRVEIPALVGEKEEDPPDELVLEFVNRTTGAPVPNLFFAVQTVEFPADSRELAEHYAPYVTDEQGRARWSNPLETIARARYNSRNGSRSFRTRSHELERIYVENVTTLQGRVLDPDGRPVPGATIWSSDNGSSCPPSVVTHSGEHGEFGVSFAESTARRLWARAPGLASPPTMARFENPTHWTTLTLELAPASIECRVAHPDRTAASNTLVVLYPRLAWPKDPCASNTRKIGNEKRARKLHPATQQFTDDAGYVNFDSLFSGRYTLFALAADGSSATTELVVDEGTASWNPVLAAGGSATGVLLDRDGMPWANAIVTTYTEDPYGRRIPDAAMRQTRTDDSGSFVLLGVPPGSTVLVAADDDATHIVASKTIEVRPGERVVQDLQESEQSQGRPLGRLERMVGWEQATRTRASAVANSVGLTVTLGVSVSRTFFPADRDSLRITVTPDGSEPDLNHHDGRVQRNIPATSFTLAPGTYRISLYNRLQLLAEQVVEAGDESQVQFE